MCVNETEYIRSGRTGINACQGGKFFFEPVGIQEFANGCGWSEGASFVDENRKFKN